jgi:hypothetical protein
MQKSKIKVREVNDGGVRKIKIAVLADVHLNMSYSEPCGFPIC